MRIKRYDAAPPEMDMTPMIDMTFQLICFFMVALSFDEADRSEKVRLPSSELANPAEAAFELPITLQLTSEGTVIYAGEELALANLGSRLVAEVQVMERLGKKPSDATVIIRADGDAPTGKVQELIQACQERRFEVFALRARQEQS
jgi:biopolymer transport protein ExbD